jgi:hypothetical protein
MVVAAVAAVEAGEDNLSVKAAGNESVDGRMTACDDEIGRRTTTQQPTNERWRDGGGGGGSAQGDGAVWGCRQLLPFDLTQRGQYVEPGGRPA